MFRKESQQVPDGASVNARMEGRQKVYSWAFRGRGRTGGERPHKRLLKFDAFRTSGVAGSEKPEMMQFLRYFGHRGFPSGPLTSHQSRTIQKSECSHGRHSSSGQNGFVIALTYGRESEWVKNVLAAGGCELETRGVRYQLSFHRA